VEALPLASVTAEAGLNTPQVLAPALTQPSLKLTVPDVELSRYSGLATWIWMGAGRAVPTTASLCTASGKGGYIEQAVDFETLLGSDIEPAVGHGLNGKKWPTGGTYRAWGLTRGVEHLESSGVKGEELGPPISHRIPLVLPLAEMDGNDCRDTPRF